MRRTRRIEPQHGRPGCAGDPESVGRQNLQWYELGVDDPARGPWPSAIASLEGLAATGLTIVAYAARTNRSRESIKGQMRSLRAYYGLKGKTLLAVYVAAVQAGDIVVNEPLPAADVTGYKLWPQQRQALYLYSVYGNRKAVAVAMGIAERTVARHLEKAARALGVSGTMQAYTKARRLHLL